METNYDTGHWIVWKPMQEDICSKVFSLGSFKPHPEYEDAVIHQSLPRVTRYLCQLHFLDGKAEAK